MRASFETRGARFFRGGAVFAIGLLGVVACSDDNNNPTPTFDAPVTKTFDAPVSTPDAPASGVLGLKTLSSQPYAVSGGDTLVQVTMTAGMTASDVSLKLNGTEVGASLESSGDTTLIGLVTGLPEGNSTLVASSKSSAAGSATLAISNYPTSGPIFSGPHQDPFVCETGFFPDLGGVNSTNVDCSVPTKTNYFYRATDASWKTLDPQGTRPGDIAMTTTAENMTVPYIVRQEIGVINRAVYVINILHDPAGALSTTTTRTSGYNGRLIYSFGGGCQAGYHQGRSVGGLSAVSHNLEETQVGYMDYFLSKGYAEVGGSLNVTGTNCADLISAETASMIKEKFIEEFGPPRYTIGAGGSGGSMQQHMLGNNYPGLLDGIMPGRAFPDMMTFLMPLFDCELIVHAINNSQLDWTADQKTAVSGYQDYGYCVSNGTRYPNLRATNCNVASLPMSLWWNAGTKTGARCTYQDNLVNVFGKDENGYARRPFDNVGVQYGLNALNAGTITFDQFADLNQRAGGQDIDGNVTATRMVADPTALGLAFQTGRINEFTGGDVAIPIIDVRSYLDFVQPGPNVDVHTAYFSRVNRARFEAANAGNHDNQVVVTTASLGTLAMDTGMATSPLGKAQRELFNLMDQWLAAIAADTAAGTPAQKVARNKPAALVDSCYDSTGTKITDAVMCATMFPYHNDPRLVAGAPATDDVFKCQLKPVVASDYNPALTTDQVNQVKAIFPDGVCDYSKPDAHKAPLAGTWLSYPTPGTVVPLN